ncbi:MULTISPECIES: RAQPRD family integrative conjugative element protein [Bordetella]|uniref:Integrative conjugative element protein, RAQPRD family n=2 Tax=Bordetella TaxID=517 RepID=A0A157SDU7_9BORD|nr:MULTISPECIES: RAQPRD family integrative conjugative element protein [Bordetella]OZI62787.1 RAQPRD family plasmid [Bordetella genomosp. 11]SAI68605.1 integrative conjugative element protein%2C RAQPRD family [Bordetella ansorpii]
MLAPIWQRAAHCGVPTFLVMALLLGQSPMTLAESPAQRQELAAALRQLDALERTVADSASHTPIQPGERYHFDYPRLLADLARVRAGIQAHLTPSRAQPRDLSELAGSYRTERAAEPLPTTTAQGKP